MLRSLVTLPWILATAWHASVPGSVAPSAPHSGSGSVPAECLEPSGNLPFFYDLYTFRGEAGKTAIVAAYAVQAGRLRREEEEGCTQYRLVVSLVLADTAERSVSRTDDSVTVRLSRSPRRDHLLRAHLEVQALPTASTLQRVIMSDVTRPGVGQLYQGPFPIRDYSGSALMLSDVALGDPGAEDGWRRGDVTLALLPTGRLPQGAFNLYYEIYNLPEGSVYTTEIAIQRIEGDAGEPGGERSVDEVRTRFTGESPAGDDGLVPELRRVESHLPPGRYRLTVTIRDEESGQTAERSRPFQIGD